MERERNEQHYCIENIREELREGKDINGCEGKDVRVIWGKTFYIIPFTIFTQDTNDHLIKVRSDRFNITLQKEYGIEKPTLSILIQTDTRCLFFIDKEVILSSIEQWEHVQVLSHRNSSITRSYRSETWEGLSEKIPTADKSSTSKSSSKWYRRG